MGTPKALVHDPDGTSWLRRSVRVLRRGGCAPVVVVLGAESGPAAALLTDQDVTLVVADDWVEGMGASLRAGLAHLLATDSTVAVISLVDLPDVGPDVVKRVTGAAGDGAAGDGSAVLARAAYDGVPGHPVVIGREHWPAVISCAVGDRGARDFLAGRPVELVECGDLAHGFDVDTRESLS